MFYSHTFLARKGPLGTVWFAAHLQHKLKKSHIASTDIPSTVERILYPEVPIALRMSGHLLLGVVRIYSKKVDYFHQDCTALRVSLLNIFRPVNVDLAENVNQAQFNAITFPETYALDALEIDATEGSQDTHLRSLEEITLGDQHPAEGDYYVKITFNDETFPDSTQAEQSEGDTMQIDNPPEVPIPLSPDTQNAGPSSDTQSAGPSSDIPMTGPIPDILSAGLNQNEEREGVTEGERSPCETMRYNQDSDINILEASLQQHKENVDPNLNTKDIPEMEIDMSSLQISPSMQSDQPPQLGVTSSPVVDVNASAIDVSLPKVSLRKSPTAEQPKPKPVKRKRKQFFDESLVLTNEFVKNALNDCTDIVKKRKKLPCSRLEQWRENKKRKNNTDIFSEPVITGMCDDLQNLSSGDFNPKLVVIGHQLDSRTTQSNFGEETERLPSPVQEGIPNVDEETEPIHSLDHEALNVGEETQHPPSEERLRSRDHERRQSIGSLLPSSSLQFSPQTQATAETSSTLKIPSSISELQYGTSDPRSDLGMFTDSTVFEMDTPILHSEDRSEGIHTDTALSVIPELRKSLDDDLSFLELDNSSPSDSPGTHKGNTSARTRALAQYLKNHSPLSNFPDGPTDLSLNTILEGRPRKLCARMFYEVTVLKSEGLIEVQQNEAYGDITLKFTSNNLDKIDSGTK